MKKRNTWKRVGAVILSVIMAGTLMACGGSDEDENEGSGKLNTSSYDEVVDMQGYEFTIATPFMVDDPDPSELNAQDLIFEEVRAQVEKDYNCKITIISHDNLVENVRTKILAGEKIADIIDVEGYHLLPMARAGYLVPLEKVEGIDLSASRWVESYTKATEFNGQHYGVNFMLPPEARVCMIYNRDLLEEYGIEEDPQELMANNEWTFDKFRELCKATTRDTNGDGENETYGCYVQLPETFGTSMISANGGSVVTSVDGVAKESYDDPKVLTALNLIYDMMNKDKTLAHSISPDGDVDDKEQIANFIAGKYAFYYCETWQLNKLLKPSCGDLDYGIVSIPMGPDAKDYVCPSENVREFCITSTNKDVDKTVIILNALARYTEQYGEENDWWLYDVQKDYFQDWDTTSVEVYKTLLDKATFDMGVGVTDLWKSLKTQAVWDACFHNKGTPASKIDAMSGKYQSTIDAVYN